MKNFWFRMESGGRALCENRRVDLTHILQSDIVDILHCWYLQILDIRNLVNDFGWDVDTAKPHLQLCTFPFKIRILLAGDKIHWQQPRRARDAYTFVNAAWGPDEASANASEAACCFNITITVEHGYDRRIIGVDRNHVCSRIRNPMTFERSLERQGRRFFGVV